MNEIGTIAVVGGTGKLGSAIAARLSRAGYRIVVGSRSSESAEAEAKRLGNGAEGMSNADAAAAGDLIFITVPFSAQAETLEQVAPFAAGKIVVDTTVPLVPPKVMRVQLPAEGSAAQCAAKVLGEDIRLVSGFHNVAAHKLAQDIDVECDVFVFGDDKDAREVVVGLAREMGLRGIHAGALANSAAAEAMTSLLIFINKRYGVDGAGIRITGELSAKD
ncbi:NADPH-dependent F420 reductase [Novosphingobium marinum]|nr:NADPH-dependent F420 reductase [Novosphingobium marinum]GGC27705.1 NADPH-dependent F420 reductase [Novosphingobium marinum]